MLINASCYVYNNIGYIHSSIVLPKSISHHHGVISMGGNKERKEDEQYQYLKQLYPKTRRSRSENKRKICLFNSGNV